VIVTTCQARCCTLSLRPVLEKGVANPSVDLIDVTLTRLDRGDSADPMAGVCSDHLIARRGINEIVHFMIAELFGVSGRSSGRLTASMMRAAELSR
jgi:hypothetical protein